MVKRQDRSVTCSDCKAYWHRGPTPHSLGWCCRGLGEHRLSTPQDKCFAPNGWWGRWPFERHCCKHIIPLDGVEANREE